MDTTEQKFFTFLEILRLKNTELWESKLNHFSLLGRGDLQLLHSQSLELTILKFHNNTWVLDKDLQIIGTRSLRGEWQAYSIVSPGGFFCLKINNLEFFSKPHAELINFETIIEDRANFIRNTSLESRFDLFKEAPKSGLQSVTGSIMKVVETITSTVAHSDYTTHANYQIVRPLKDLFDVDSVACPIVDMPEGDINNYKTETRMLHDYQNLGEWKTLWDIGNTDYLQGFSQMNLGESKQQGQEAESLDKPKTEESNYQQPPPGKHHHDAQEVLGGEQQRLPSYEVSHSKEHVSDGLERASSNIQGETKPEFQREESNEFTTGLLKGDIDVKTQPEPSPKTPYHKNELENPPTDLEKSKSQQEKVDLPKESLKMEAWGSNVTNPSETTASIDSDFKTELKGDFRAGENRTTMDKVNNESENMKETAAP